MFNEKVKEQFINENAKSKISKFKRIFKESAIQEIMLDKDLCDFNISELKTFFFFLGDENIRQVNESFRLIRNYIDYTISHGLKQNNVNPLLGITQEWKNQFIEKQ